MFPILIFIISLNHINSLDIIELHNPFLPINLGNAKLIYTNHIFIHYFNYKAIEDPINQIKENIKIAENCYAQLKTYDKDEDLEFISSAINIDTLHFYIVKVMQKYQNFNPQLSLRPKRGLLNPIGTIYKAAFGLLDSEDGDKIYNAIETLDKKQKNIYTSLGRQMSLSKELIKRLNTSLTIISTNQKLLNK